MPPDLALLIEAAHGAGAIALSQFRTDIEVWEKPDGAGPVSAADLAVNALLHKTLTAARPAYGWLSEEDPDTPARLAAERVFIVDPIDGTRAFLAGKDGFAVSIAIVERGVPVAGVVHLPAMGFTYAAAAGQGATLDGRPLETAPAPGIGVSRVLTTKASLKPEQWPGGVPTVTPHFRSSLAWRLCLVADGSFDGLITLRSAHEWDLAAGSLIAAEAGAMVTDRDGAACRFNEPVPLVPGIIAAPAGLHTALMAGRRAPSMD